MPLFRISDPFIFTLFGASGDLARLKIYPALYQLALQKRLPQTYYLVGFSRTEKDRQTFVEEIRTSIQKKEGHYVNESVLKSLLEHVYYFTGQYTERQSFDAYRAFLSATTGGRVKNHLAYFSVPPTMFSHIVQHLSETKTSPNEDLKFIIEKPFGSNRASAEELYHFVIQHASEEQVYLLDHYLGKSAVQSILHLRHSNRILNTLLRGSEIANIQVTAFEDIGIGERVGYFDSTGIIKDMVQSHLLQTLALVTMSIPITECAESIHRERYNILSAMQPTTDPKLITIGQYTSYKKERKIPKKSTTETFVALRLEIDREDWYHVPVYLRTGKKTQEKHTFVTIELKKNAFQKPDEEPNRIVIDLQPNARVTINLINRLGELQQYQDVLTSASIACDIDGCLPDHAALILDALKGDKTFFLSFPEILETWRITDAILDTIKKKKIKLEQYADGSSGPASQDNITHHDGFVWHDAHR